MNFRSNYSFVDRKNETQMILLKYPDRIPIICEKSLKASNDCPDIDKKKYLVPNDLTVGQFIYVIRRRLRLTPEKAIYLFINNMIPSTSDLLYEIYYHSKSEDGFLYITYTSENTFG